LTSSSLQITSGSSPSCEFRFSFSPGPSSSRLVGHRLAHLRMWRNQPFVLDTPSDVLSADTSICRDVGCKTVADMIKGKSPEEIRKQFNVVNDFTPEEEVRSHSRYHYSANRLTSSDLRSTGSNQEGERVGRRSMNDKTQCILCFWLSSSCSSLLCALLFTPSAVQATPPASLPENFFISYIPTLLLGTLTCLCVISRYSAAAPNKHASASLNLFSPARRFPPFWNLTMWR